MLHTFQTGMTILEIHDFSKFYWHPTGVPTVTVTVSTVLENNLLLQLFLGQKTAGLLLGHLIVTLGLRWVDLGGSIRTHFISVTQGSALVPCRNFCLEISLFFKEFLLS